MQPNQPIQLQLPIMLPVVLLIIFVCTLVLVPMALYAGHIYEKGRTEAFSAVAQELSFEVGDQQRVQQFIARGLPLFSVGRGARIWNVLLAEGDSETVYLFDYRYTVGSGKNSHTYKQTVAGIDAQQLRLPWFELHPETLLHKIGHFLGGHDIDFASHPQFSQRYVLRGEREEEIRRVFASELLEHLEATSGLRLEASGTCLVYYRQGKRVPPHELKEFLREAFTIYGMLKNAESPTAE